VPIGDTLGGKPALISRSHGIFITRYALRDEPHPTPQQTFCGEKRHLCVISNFAFTSIRGGKIGNTHWTKAIQYLRSGHELDRASESVAYRTAE
jgi:hypothetical protein